MPILSSHYGFPMNEMMAVIDGQGEFWRNILSVNTMTGEMEVVRQAVLPKPGEKLITSIAWAPLPITITFYGKEQADLLQQGIRPRWWLDEAWMLWKREQEEKKYQEGYESDVTFMPLFGNPYPEPVSDANEPESASVTNGPAKEGTKERFVCPCCAAPMIEKYSTTKKWYLKCVECPAQVIR